DLSHGDCGQTFPNNSDSVDGFDSASCHRNDDGYHSSASSLSSEDDFRSTSKNSCRRLGPNHGGNNGGGVSGSSSPAGVSTNARRSASTTMGGGSAAAAARIVVGSDFSDDGGSGSDDTQKIPSDFSLISAPRVSMGAAGAAARDGGGFDGGRYRRSEDDCEWQPATGNNYLWELQAKGQRGTAFSVPASLYDRMYAHQREGVKWLWQLHQGGVGGILGDDMGLGKTFQVCCLLAGLVSTKQASSALIIAPKSVLRGWEAELQEWFIKACCRNAEVYVVGSEMSVRNRRVTLRSAAFGGALGKGAVVICTYGIVSANPAMFDPLRGDGRNHKWDYVVLDEGHKIKNPSTKVCKAVHQVPAKRRLVLSGTPVQNNLRELHTVVDWATFGTVLGPFEEFQRR
ncbi:unnamed protein product, partial [Sphacelaria rigidula]